MLEQPCPAIRRFTTPGVSHCPCSWIDTYYPILNAGRDRSLERLDNGTYSECRTSIRWRLRDEDAHKYGGTIPTGDGLSFYGRCLEYSSPPLVPRQGEICIVHRISFTLYLHRRQNISDKWKYRGHYSPTTPIPTSCLSYSPPPITSRLGFPRRESDKSLSAVQFNSNDKIR